MSRSAQNGPSTSMVGDDQNSSHIPRGPIIAQLKFFAPPTDGSKPWNYPNGVDPPEGMPRRNFGDLDLPVEIQDIRGRESQFNLDKNAFSTLKTGQSVESNFDSDETIKANYYPEVEQLLLKHIQGASRVFLFDHTLRRAGNDRPPVLRVHIDQTTTAAIGRVKQLLPEEAKELLKGRIRIINVWRPLNGPVQCTPLAFADSSTVPNEALVAVEHRYKDRTGETLSGSHTDEKWYYWSGMENDERLLLQCFDSEKGGRVPHSAFVDPRSPERAKPRESIEVRALVFG